MNPELVYRMVGYYEYGRALYLLDQLVRSSTPEELQLFDRIVAKRDEYTIYTNRSRYLEREPSGLSEGLARQQAPARGARRSGGDASGNPYESRGLAWVMALARVELGALAAGFSSQPEPFAMAPPTAYDLTEYSEIMLDSLRTHYWALRNDPAMANFRRLNDTACIAYGRRISITLEFLAAVRELGANQFTPVQVRELQAWERELSQVRGLLFGELYRRHPPATTVDDRNTNSFAQLFANCNCPLFLRGFRHALATGRVEVDGHGVTGAEAQEFLRLLNPPNHQPQHPAQPQHQKK